MLFAQEAGFTEREDAELARFLRMLPLWGTHLSRLDSVSAFQRLSRQEQSVKLVSCIIVRLRPNFGSRLAQ